MFIIPKAHRLHDKTPHYQFTKIVEKAVYKTETSYVKLLNFSPDKCYSLTKRKNKLLILIGKII